MGELSHRLSPEHKPRSPSIAIAAAAIPDSGITVMQTRSIINILRAFSGGIVTLEPNAVAHTRVASFHHD